MGSVFLLLAEEFDTYFLLSGSLFATFSVLSFYLLHVFISVHSDFTALSVDLTQEITLLKQKDEHSQMRIGSLETTKQSLERKVEELTTFKTKAQGSLENYELMCKYLPVTFIKTDANKTVVSCDGLGLKKKN